MPSRLQKISTIELSSYLLFPDAFNELTFERYLRVGCMFQILHSGSRQKDQLSSRYDDVIVSAVRNFFPEGTIPRRILQHREGFFSARYVRGISKTLRQHRDRCGGPRYT